MKELQEKIAELQAIVEEQAAILDKQEVLTRVWQTNNDEFIDIADDLKWNYAYWALEDGITEEGA